MQQSPKIGFERCAAFSKQVGSRGGEREDRCHNLVAGALHDVGWNFEPMTAGEAGRSPNLFLAAGFIGRQQALSVTRDRPETTLYQLVDRRMWRPGMGHDRIGVDTLVSIGMYVHASSAILEHAQRDTGYLELIHPME